MGWRECLHRSIESECDEKRLTGSCPFRLRPISLETSPPEGRKWPSLKRFGMREFTMRYKNHDEMSEIESCPPFAVREANGTAYRFVHENLEDPRNFTCAKHLNPRRTFRTADKQCSSLGLSMYITADAAERAWRYFSSQFQNFAQQTGTHLAIGDLCPDDGHISLPDRNGHFDLWEAEHSNVSRRFSMARSF